jgi:S1-C subfamily serine protease
VKSLPAILLILCLAAAPAGAESGLLKFAVVQIESSAGTGSGTVVRLGRGAPAYVLTCAHVVGDDGEVTIRWPGGAAHTGTVVETDADADLAAVTSAAAGRSHWVAVADDVPPPGARVWKVGYPLGVGPRTGEADCEGDLNSRPPRFGTGVPVAVGDSGGGVFTADGLLCGVITGHRTDDPDRRGLAVPARVVREFLAEVRGSS